MISFLLETYVDMPQEAPRLPKQEVLFNTYFSLTSLCSTTQVNSYQKAGIDVALIILLKNNNQRLIATNCSSLISQKYVN
jgi:hypothetical protein